MVDYDWSSLAVAIDTAPRTSWRDAPAGRNVVVDVRKGMVVLDVIADGTIERIVCIEVLGRGDVRARLRELAERGRERER
jgi:hypothetical protein